MFDVNPLASVLTGDESNIAPSVAAVNDGLGTKANSTHDHDASYDAIGTAAEFHAQLVDALEDKAPLDHNHDSVYSAIGHDHDADYDPIGAAAAAVSALGLGTSATYDVPVSGDAASDEVVLGNDSRLSGGGLEPDGDGSLLTGITASQVGAVEEYVTSYPLRSASGYVLTNNTTLGTNAASFGVGAKYAVLLHLGKAITINGLTISVSSAGGVGQVTRLGIYNRKADGGVGTLVIDAGTVASDSTGLKTASFSDITLPPGEYCLCLRAAGAGTSPSIRGGSPVFQDFGRELTTAQCRGCALIYRTYGGMTDAAFADETAETWTPVPGANVYNMGLLLV